jgi:hypothetical protein
VIINQAHSTQHRCVPVQTRTSPLYEPVRMLPGPPATALTLLSGMHASALFNTEGVQMHLLDGCACQLDGGTAAHQSSWGSSLLSCSGRTAVVYSTSSTTSCCRDTPTIVLC